MCVNGCRHTHLLTCLLSLTFRLLSYSFFNFFLFLDQAWSIIQKSETISSYVQTQVLSRELGRSALLLLHSQHMHEQYLMQRYIVHLQYSTKLYQQDRKNCHSACIFQKNTCFQYSLNKALCHDQYRFSLHQRVSHSLHASSQLQAYNYCYYSYCCICVLS